MRKARYDLQRVICKNSSCIGHSSNVAKPGYWIEWGDESGGKHIGRVLGRIAETDNFDCIGFLAVMELGIACRHGFIRWVDPVMVRDCYDEPPARLLAWISGKDWVKSKNDIGRIIAMAEYGTVSEAYIDSRDDPEKRYNANPEYIKQFVL